MLNKKIKILFLLFSIILNSQNIAVKELSAKYDCRGCPGSLVVKNENKVDTIFGGQWGNPPEYKFIEINNKEYLHIFGNYGFAMGLRTNVNKLYSLDNETFLEKVFEKEHITYRETFREYNGLNINFVIEREIKTTIENGFKFEIKLTIRSCPEILGYENCDEIITETMTEFYPINLYYD